MNKIIGAIFIIIGLILIGIGSYQQFSDFGKALSNSVYSQNYYDGLYITSGDSLTVTSQSDTVLSVILNDRYYEFVYNGSFYEDRYSGFGIVFEDNSLTLYKDGEKIRTLHKK